MSSNLNNIFDYAPKELVMDAFFAWIFNELNKKELSEHKLNFFNSLKLKGFNKDSQITNIQKQKSNTDLIVTIDGKEILFENKTTSTIHSNQLEDYKKDIPGCKDYIYMKLAFIDYKEKLEAKKHGYHVVGIEDIEKALKPLKDCCQIVTQYYDFLDKKYIKKLEEIKNGMRKNQANIYKHSDAQRIFLSELHEKLHEGVHKKLHSRINNDDLFFRYSANRGGSPWTQLRIAHKDKQYGQTNEYIFWRIDKKKEKGYYIRLTQYANIDSTYKTEKRKRLKQLREYFKELVDKSNLKSSKVSNHGLKSSEIGIFYFKDNKYAELSEALVNLSIEFVKEYI